MSLVRKSVLLILVLSLLPLVNACGGAYPFIWRAFPQTAGALSTPGLREAVVIRRDTWGVPHITASSERDAWFAQGYVHAQDRLWQMDYQRRIAAGRLAEILGADALPADRWMRTLGLSRRAEREWQALDGAAQDALRAYADGVNAFIAARSGRLAVEFSLLRYTPEPWAPADSLAIVRWVALAWDSQWEEILFRGEVLAALGVRAQELLGDDVKPLPELEGVAWDAQAVLAEWQQAQPWLGAWSRGVGSNGWAVDGSMTASGKPLLAGDVQLQPAIPSPWYEVHLAAGALDVSGASVPGVPGVWLGHNQRIAWALVNGAPFAQQVYVERVNPANADQVEFAGQWATLDVRHEEIRVKGTNAPERLTVRSTRHGPLLPSRDASTALALHWNGFDEGGPLAALLALNRAQDQRQLVQAARAWVVPAVGLLYADVDGAIGLHRLGPAATHAPATAVGVPLPGWSNRYEAELVVPNDPTSGAPQYIISADALLLPGAAPQAVAGASGAPFRAQRVAQLLGAGELSVEACRALQADVYSIPATLVAERALAMPAEGWLWERAVNFLRGWDGMVEVPSGAAALAETAWRRLLVNTFSDEIAPRTVPEERWDAASDVLARILPAADNAWFDDVRTPQRETRDDVLSKSLHEAMDYWGNHRGDLVGNKDEQWGWGQEHTATFAHPAASSFWLRLLLNRGPILTRGSWDTVAVAEWELSHLKVTRATSYRQIIDLADWDNARAGHTTGQSGHPWHEHYADMLKDWHHVQPHPMSYTAQGVATHSESVLQLVP